jgi:predicted HTH transcriptional regulator
LFKTRLVFLSNNNASKRHSSQLAFIQKVQNVLVRKTFYSIVDLKASVYASLVRILFDREIIRSGPFDASYNEHASIDDIDTEKIRWFIRIARSKRGFPLPEETETSKVLTHLNLLNENRISNAALLLFAKEPQRFFINSEVRCAQYYGIEVAKPIPTYKVFKGNVFELVDQSLNFVLSKLDYSIGTRENSVQIPGKYEMPKEIITEAIVNSIAHRDYTSNGSVQIMLFADRLEIWNPGILPLGWTTEKLKKLHASVPANPLLADPMYLAGYIERMGTGTMDMIRLARKSGLKEPEFIQEDSFIVKVFRKSTLENTSSTTQQVTQQVEKLIRIISGEMTRDELLEILKLKDRENFRKKYIIESLNTGIIEMTQPDSPNSPTQKYRLTAKGKQVQAKLNKK